MTQWGPPVYKIALRALSFSAVWAVHSIDKDWCRMIVELPHRYGGLGLTPLPASGLAAFYSATARLVSWLGSLPQSHSSHWVCDQDLAECNTWTSSPSAPSRWCTLNSLRTTDALSGPRLQRTPPTMNSNAMMTMIAPPAPLASRGGARGPSPCLTKLHSFVSTLGILTILS